MKNENLSNKELNKAIRQLDLKKINERNSYTILLIDDDQWMHRLINNYTRQWGFQLMSAFNPIDGIAAAIKEKPAIILLDIIMQDMTGDMVLKLFKGIEITRNIPIIIISGNLNSELLGNTYRDGAMDFISKPVNEHVLFEKLKAAMIPVLKMEEKKVRVK